MTCPEISRYLHAYCDGELDPSTMLEVDGHLQGCLACRRAFDAEQAFREELRRKVSQERVPPDIAEKLRSAIAELDDRQNRFPRLPAPGRRAWLAVAAAVLLLIVGALLGTLIPPRGRQSATQAILPALVREHLRSARVETPVELESGSAQQVAFWFRGKIGHAVLVPDYNPMGVQLLGGRVIQLADARAASIVYRKGRKVLSLFSFKGTPETFTRLRAIERDAQIFLAAELSGQQILLWQRGEMMYALVADVGWDALFQCARAFFETVES